MAVKKVDHTEFSKYTEEAKFLLKIDSPYVVQLITAHTSAPFTYLIMELCDTDLGDILTDYTFLNTTNMDTVAKHVAAGYKVYLQHFHASKPKLLAKFKTSEFANHKFKTVGFVSLKGGSANC